MGVWNRIRSAYVEPCGMAAGPRTASWADLDVMRSEPHDPATWRSAHVLNRARDSDREVVSGALSWAEMVLRGQAMPPEEMRVVLTTADRELVRRYLELHLERLEELLITQRRSVAAIERILADTAERPHVAKRPPQRGRLDERVCSDAMSRGTPREEDGS